MKRVITYGTYDLLHIGHIKLLERAKALGDYLIVGVTADDFDKKRGKINVQQSLMERIEAVRATGLADKIIIEEYEGQKIDDIQKYDVDVFTVGSDWIGKFDYLKDYCEVIYLERTKGISSSDIRISSNKIRVGIIGDNNLVVKYYNECKYVNGIEIVGIRTDNTTILSNDMINLKLFYSDDELIESVNAVFVISHPDEHFDLIAKCLKKHKHVMCESPVGLTKKETETLMRMAEEKKCILYDSVKTAYSTAYARALLLIKGGKIGEVVSISATCTSLFEAINQSKETSYKKWNSICAWGPTAFLPILQLFGVNYKDLRIVSKMLEDGFDGFSEVVFIYDKSIATATVGKAVKSEGELIISGTEGYVYIPAPWWKTDYFEIRYENTTDNKRYFYQLDGEGIRNEIVSFVRSIKNNKSLSKISASESIAISSIIESFNNKDNMTLLD